LFAMLFLGCAGNSTNNNSIGPETPSNLEGFGVSSTSIILTWQDNSNDELGFDVYRAGATWLKIGNVGVDITTFTDHELQDSTQYRYYVEAIGAVGNSEKSNVVSVYTSSIGVPPEMPHDQIPYNGDDTIGQNITLTWECSDLDGDTLTYDLYFGLISPPPLLQSNLTENSFEPSVLALDTIYYWQVAAADGHHHTTFSPVWYFGTFAPRE